MNCNIRLDHHCITTFRWCAPTEVDPLIVQNVTCYQDLSHTSNFLLSRDDGPAYLFSKNSGMTTLAGARHIYCYNGNQYDIRDAWLVGMQKYRKKLK